MSGASTPGNAPPSLAPSLATTTRPDDRDRLRLAREVHEHQPAIRAGDPLVREDAVGRVAVDPLADLQGRGAAARREETAVEVEDGPAIRAQGRERARGGLRRPRQPGVRGPAVQRRRVPRNRRATAVAPAGVDATIRRYARVLQTELLAGVEERRARQREEQHGGGARPRLRSEPRAMARRVVIREHDGRPRPGRGVRRLDGPRALSPVGRGPRRVERAWQIEDQVELVAAAVVPRHVGLEEQEDLADQHAIARIGVDQPPQRAQALVRGLDGRSGRRAAAPRRRRDRRPAPDPSPGTARRRRGTRRCRGRARSARRRAWPRRPRDCPSRGPAARGESSAGSTGRSPDRGSMPASPTERPPSSCWAARRSRPGRATRTRRASGSSASAATRRTRDDGPTCGSAPSRGAHADRARAPRRPGGRGPPASRRGDRRRGSRRRRSRSPPSASGRSARARSRRRRARRDGRGAAGCLRDRRPRPRRCRRTSADRSGTPRRSATTVRLARASPRPRAAARRCRRAPPIRRRRRARGSARAPRPARW